MNDVSRRDTLKLIAVVGASVAPALAAGCEAAGRDSDSTEESAKMKDHAIKSTSPILGMEPLEFVWPTSDPFLFCVHHDDKYPPGDASMGPVGSLEGRNLGNDFKPKDGWRMYHGRVIPGFPQHPHRGFETVTVVREGLLDHSDSMGAAARYGEGDVQWMTAGKGILHAEMFPLLKQDAPNPLELFQIWVNLPGKNKMVEPHFGMLWDGKIPRVQLEDEAGRKTELRVVAGRFGEHQAPPPPPHSWASDPKSDMAIWTLRMEPGAKVILPKAKAGTDRSLYLFKGAGATIAGEAVPNGRRVRVKGDGLITIEAGAEETELLLLQGRPIGEPVAHYGPFVMNTQAELKQAFSDYRETQFGGWPWERDDAVHPREAGRFARHADGREESPA